MRSDLSMNLSSIEKNRVSHQQAHRTVRDHVVVATLMAFALGLAVPVPVRALGENPVAHAMTFEPFVAAGYAYVANGELNAILQKTIQEYRNFGIPINSQTQFGHNMFFSAGVMTGRIPKIKLGLSAAYFYTVSYSGYRDFAGSLRIDGKLDRLEILFSFQYDLFDVAGVRVAGLIEPGYNHCIVRLVKETRYLSPAGFGQDLVWSGNSDGVSIRLSLSARVETDLAAFEFMPGFQMMLARFKTEKSLSSVGDIATANGAELGGNGVVIQVRIFPQF